MKIEIVNADPTETIQVFGTGASEDTPPVEIGPRGRVGFHIGDGNSILVCQAPPTDVHEMIE